MTRHVLWTAHPPNNIPASVAHSCLVNHLTWQKSCQKQTIDGRQESLEKYHYFSLSYNIILDIIFVKGIEYNYLLMNFDSKTISSLVSCEILLFGMYYLSVCIFPPCIKHFIWETLRTKFYNIFIKFNFFILWILQHV